MSTSFRPCLHCDYLLPADRTQTRCPECGQENTFAEIDLDAEAAFAAPMNTVFRGRVFSNALLSKLWRCPPQTHGRVRRFAVIALLAGLVLPAVTLMLSAAVSLKTTVLCTPYPVTEVPTPQGPKKICSPYHRPQYVEYNWFTWYGWNLHGDQQGDWAHRGVLPFERIDRALIGRSIVLQPVWTKWPEHIIRDFAFIVANLASWWILAAVWLAWVKRKMRISPMGADSIAVHPDIKAFCNIVLATSGIILAAVIAIDLIVRLTVPEIKGGWHAISRQLPWSIAIPAALLWRVSSKGPPSVARWATWPTLVFGAACAIVIRHFARLRNAIPTPPQPARARRGAQLIAEN